jgi:thymidine kinase
MYSGKSEELVRRLRLAQIAGQSVQAFKPAMDDRYRSDAIATHLGGTFEARPVGRVQDIMPIIADVQADVVAFDEAQFMEPDLIPILNNLSVRHRVIVAGLNLDYLGNPFGPIPTLLALADAITQLWAVCVAPTSDGGVCGEVASRSYRVPEADSGALVQVGSEGIYEARCRKCWSQG